MATELGSKRGKNQADSSLSSSGSETVHVDQFTNGLLDPAQPMLGPVSDGGRIIANTTPGCWGPMITPALRGGHEVTKPVAVAGAEVGDAVVIRIKEIKVTSLATASGNDAPMEGRFLGDPYVAGRCPECETLYPETVLKGIGPTSVRCAKCDAEATPFTFRHGYTIAFDQQHSIGVTVNQEAAENIARDARRFAAIPKNSVQNPILTFAPHDIVGLTARLRPFMGQLGTTPSVCLPDSHNAGDFGIFLVGAPHEYAITAEELEQRTDGHMDVDAVRAGAILVCPVKVAGAGIYLGDMHALQGDGEIAGHTCDVAGMVTIEVNVLKGLNIDGPLLFPLLEDLPYLARPLSEAERERAQTVAKTYGIAELEETVPVSVIGTGCDLNAATDNGLERAAKLLDISVPEVKNRATLTGAIEIGRHPGVVQITFQAPAEKLNARGLLPLAIEQYGANDPE